ncbi:MAG: glycoside hydrolase family 3 C-terminal domain-containing protein [Spirochaetaceae bacterium]|jgi:beta-glucosidase|nr:glycoside hydrolase family 3 C-terminal domain-containing protein [Spirochaetaceae bacterium]
MDYQSAVKIYQADNSSWKEQAQALRSEMTLDEKIYMLSGHPFKQALPDMLKYNFRYYNVHAFPAGGCKRLGVPPVLFTDGPRGVVMLNSTCFPVSMLRASTFDTNLEYRVGQAIAAEGIAQGANYFAGVCINLVRNPRWGRSQETYGEDPCLLGEFGATLTKAVQDDGMIACPKHYAVNSIEDLRFYVDVHCDDRTLHEVYLPHFKKCIDAGALSIMAAYNRYEEEYCCQNKKLLTDILRDDWGFDGFTMSDFIWGCHDTAGCLRAGLDVEMVFTNHYSASKIKKCLKKGSLNMEHIDRAVDNILGVLIRQTPKLRSHSLEEVGSKKHRELAQEVARKGMVLLENNGILPLRRDAKVMVTGPYANAANIGDAGSSCVYDNDVTTPIAGMKQLFPNASLEEGDIAIVHVGSNREMEGEYFANTGYNLKKKPEKSGGDRASLRLSAEEVNLIKKLKGEGKKVVVVLYSGCAIIVEEWKEYTDAIIMNYYSGCRGAVALAELLCGEYSFSGKLPFTVAKTEKDYPDIIGIGQKPYTIEYAYYHGYTMFDKENIVAAYPFGYGLSYTSFDMNIAAMSQTEKEVLIDVDVTNTGHMAGAEVVQVYFGSKGAANGDHRPVKLLKGFDRVDLNPGETKRVQICVEKNDLRFYDNGHWVLDKAYNIYVGHDSQNAMCRNNVIEM